MRRPHFAVRCAAAVLVAASGVTLAGCAGAPEAEPDPVSSRPDFPVTISACGHESRITAPPARAVTLSQGATEVMLALGLQDRMVGTAYLDDTIPARWQRAYDAVPVLSEEFPSTEKLLSVDPDFVYASYTSAFEPKVAGSPASLAEKGIASYLSPFGCPADGGSFGETNNGVEGARFGDVWGEVADVGRAFGVSDRAESLIRTQRRQLADVRRRAAGEGLTVFWYDSGEKAPFTGVGGGGPALVMDAVGATNPFGHIDGGWENVNWEKVVAADPDVIVLPQANWSTVTQKRRYLENDPVLSRLRAVRQQRYVTLPFTATTPGVRLADGVRQVSAQLEKLDVATR